MFKKGPSLLLISLASPLRLLAISSFFFLGTALLNGCGCKESSNPGPNGLLGCASGGGAAPIETIGPAGGTATSSDGRASIVIPARALSQETAVSVEPTTDFPGGNLGPAYSFKPIGVVVNASLAITITYDQADLSGTPAENLRLGRLVNDLWVPVSDSTVNSDTNSVRGSTVVFGIFGVVGIPNPPGNVSAIAGNGEASVSWGAVPGATAYNLYSASDPGVAKGNSSTLPDWSKNSGVSSPFDKKGLTNGKTYYFVVTAQNGAGEGEASSPVPATPIDTPVTTLPNPPTGLSATAGDAQVTLRWNAVPLAASYIVYSAPFLGVNKTNGIKHAGITGLSYTQADLTNGQTYFFVVTAVNNIGESSESSPVSARPAEAIPNPPTNLVAGAGLGQISLSWDPSPGAATYNLYIASVPGVTKTVFEVRQQGLIGLSSTQSGLTHCKIYYVVVTAVNSGGESAESSEVQNSPDPPPGVNRDLPCVLQDAKGVWTLANGTYTDESGNGNGLTPVGESGPTPAIGHHDGVNKATHFDGTQDLEISDGAQTGLDITGPLTISLWTLANVDPQPDPTTLISKTGSAGQNSFEIYIQTFGLQFALSSNGTDLLTLRNTDDIGDLVTANWLHFVCVYDGTAMKIYFNGAESGTLPYVSGIFDSNAPFRIGSLGFTGSIDDVAIWNRALSPSEVGTLFSLGDDFSEP